jgi:hypothetical protein
VSELGAPTPYPTGLFDLLRPQMSPKLIEYIALTNFLKPAVIKTLVQSERIPAPLRKQTTEALSLVKWEEPERQQGDNPMGMTLRELHISRLFCCACLLAAYPGQRSTDCEPSNVLPRLIESTVAVEPAWLDRSADLIAWLRDHCDQADPAWEEHDIDATLCRTALVIINAAADSAVEQVKLVEAVEEIFARKRRSFTRGDEQWTWLLEGGCFNQSVHIWKSLAERYLLNPQRNWSNEVSAACSRLGEAIIRDGTDPGG